MADPTAAIAALEDTIAELQVRGPTARPGTRPGFRLGLR